MFFKVGRRLRIRRTFKTADGKEFVRIEVVKNQAVIDAYLKLNKDKSVKYLIISFFQCICVRCGKIVMESYLHSFCFS